MVERLDVLELAGRRSLEPLPVFLARSLRALLPAALLALALTALFWPWAVMAPGNLLKAMTAFSHFAFELDTVLDGEVMRNGDVPGTYLAEYLLVRLPETFLAGLALAWTSSAAAGAPSCAACGPGACGVGGCPEPPACVKPRLHTLASTGYPNRVACWAKPAYDKHYGACWVGGGAAWFGEPRYSIRCLSRPSARPVAFLAASGVAWPVSRARS